MTNEIENFDTESTDEVALSPAGKAAVFTAAILTGVGAYFVTNKVMKKLEARKAEKTAEDES